MLNMDYNLSYIRNRILNDKLDDPNYEPGVIDNFINDTQREIFNTYEFPFAEKVFSGVLTPGEAIFSFPEDYDVVQSLKITSPDDNKRDITELYMPFREFNDAFPKPSVNTPAMPSRWSLHGNRLYLSQPTDVEYTLDMWYLKTAAVLADDEDVPDVPRQYEELLVLGAHYRCLERNEDFDLAAVVEAKYRNALDVALGRATKRQAGNAQRVMQPLRMSQRRRARS